MEKYYQQFAELSETSSDPRTDKKKAELLSALLRINRNYAEMKKYAEHNFFQTSSQQLQNLKEAADLNGSFIISKTANMKSSKIFSFFSKKKICIC